MAFEVASDVTPPEVPTNTTVAFYRLDRLGPTPALTVRFAETVADGTNAFGITAQRQAETGRVWDCTLTSENPDHLTYMGQLLGAVSFTLVKEALGALGITTVTDDQIVTAVGQIENIDSVIGTSLEKIEKDRRAGLDPNVIVMGTAPAAAPRPTPPPPTTP